MLGGCRTDFMRGLLVSVLILLGMGMLMVIPGGSLFVPLFPFFFLLY